MIRELAGQQEAAVTQVPSGPVPVRSSERPVSHEGTMEDVRQALSRLNEAAQAVDSRLRYQFDPDLNQVIVTILNEHSGEVIRQIPSEEIVQLAKVLEHVAGLVINERA